MTIYYNNDKTEHIDISIDPNIKKIAISMSGGVDSSLLAYLLSKEIKLKKLSTKIKPVTWRRPYPKDNPKIWNIKHALLSIKSIQVLLDINCFEDHYIFYPKESSSPLSVQDEINDWLRLQTICEERFKCDLFLYGSTCNPPLSEMKKYNMIEGRESHRDKETPREDTYIQYNPFGNVDKKFLRDIYDQEDLLHTLFPITRSCEGDSIWTRDYILTCNSCWWCKERNWAFG